MNRNKKYLINLLLPAFVFGSVTGIITAVIVTFYKLCAKYVISASENGYELLKENWYFIPAVLLVLFGISVLFSNIYKRNPNLNGGGIPTSIGILRGIITFKWLRNLIGVFFMSLTAFMIGVPLGNEGPSVQMGTAIGRGTVFAFAKNHILSRYTACIFQ
jgi:H+/Cl- antiporter ClcA